MAELEPDRGEIDGAGDALGGLVVTGGATRPGILRPVGAPSNEVAQGMEPVIGTDAHPA